jgi:hypothetical protein
MLDTLVFVWFEAAYDAPIGVTQRARISGYVFMFQQHHATSVISSELLRRLAGALL